MLTGMSGSPHFLAPTGMATVYRATLEALARYGPRRAGVTHIARLADTNRMFVYRNWSSPQALIRDATQAELKRLLQTACEVPGPVPPPGCLSVRIVVRATRLLREHPVVRALALNEPALAHMAVLRPTTVWHDTAWQWLTAHVTAHLPRGAEREAAALAVLTTTLPYALTPPQASPDPAADSTAIDRRLALATHACLGLPPVCPNC